MQFFTDAEAQDILRESRGLDSIFSLLKTAKHLSIKQYSMFALGCALARNGEGGLWTWTVRACFPLKYVHFVNMYVQHVVSQR